MALLIEPSFTGSAMPLAIDGSGLLPERLVGMTPSDVARQTLEADGRRIDVGALFAVSGDAGDGVIECRGDFARVHRLGAGMTTGRIEVCGDVGRHAGGGMAGGSLVVSGSAGDWLAAGMSGGDVVVAGSAGDHAAGSLPGCPSGVHGGRVFVAGDAGAFAGARMRRGLLVVAGCCGAAAAFELRAGTVVTRRTGLGSAEGMQRGSLVLLDAPPPDLIPGPGFTAGRVWNPPFLALFARSLPTADPGSAAWRHVATGLGGGRWRHWHGDRLHGGRGEILAREDAVTG